jgi:hypothetical protein
MPTRCEKLPVGLVVFAAAGQRVGRVGGGLLVATYALFLGLTFR